MIEKTMTSRDIEGLSLEELEAHSGEYLPDREEMSLVNTNVAAPTNVALAFNIFSDDSTAIANAEQDNYIEQNNFERNDFEQNRFEHGGFGRGGFEDGANVNFAAPTNTAFAANIGSDDSLAIANAEQDNYIEQNNFEQNNFEQNRFEQNDFGRGGRR